MKSNIKSYIYLLFLFLSPLLNLFVNNISNSYPINFLSSFIFFLFFGIMFIYICIKVFKSYSENIIFFVFFFWYFQFNINFLENTNLFNLTIFQLKILAIILILFISFFLSIYLNNYIKNFVVTFLILNFLYLGFFNNSQNFEVKKLKKNNFENIKFSTDQNIYLFILDQMTSVNIYREKYNFDMSDEINFFEKKNFIYLKDTTTNNLQTIHVLSSYFNINDNVNPSIKEIMPKNYDGHVPLLNLLAYNFYKIWYLDNDIVSCPVHRQIKCILKANVSLINSPVYHLLSVSVFKKVYNYILHEYLDSIKKKKLYSETEIDKLIKFLKNNKKLIDNGKNFFLIHNMGPHSPYRDEKCNLISFDYRMSENEIEDYISSSKCVLSRIEKLINFLDINDKDSIVILQGDHGFSLNNDFNNRDKDVFNLVRVPTKCKKSLKNGLNTINTFKNILNCI
tara:strand:+ start:477 stop:1832 length:1356 start_codon:yes stop_codon:yes gene_type:complete